MANKPQIDRMNKIIAFLKDKSNLSNKEAAKLLESIGEDVTPKYVLRLRNNKKSGLSSPDSIKERVYADLKNGVKFNTASDIEIRYKVCRGYANALMKIISKGDYDRPLNKKNEHALNIVPVNTMAFYVQQLTANDPGYEVASNG